MSIQRDPSRTPVLIGVGQRSDRQPDLDAGTTPLDLLTDAAQMAASDAGISSFASVDTIAIIPVGQWQAENQPGALAARLGATPSSLVQTTYGGEVGVRGINWLAQRIVDGESGVALLAGANQMRTIELAQRLGQTVHWDDDAPGTPQQIGAPREGTSPLEDAAGLDLPPFVYPLFENALRHHHGRDLERHVGMVGDLFARFTQVAAANPHAWFPTLRSAAELITPTPDNRMVAFPYTKYLNAILNTDQAAAVLVASVEQAQAMGVPEDRWVHWWGGNHAQEEAWFPSTRPDFAATPSMLDSHAGALDNAGCTIDDVDLIDFYSCFPSAVEMACRMLGLDLDDPRGFTVTGGLPYAGGPASAYTLHSLATMAMRLRERPDARGLVTGNGMYLSKHAASVWSCQPFPGDRLRSTSDLQPSSAFDTAPREPVARAGRGTVDTFTVIHSRDGAPERGIVLGHYDDGARFLANTPSDAEVLRSMEEGDFIGTEGEISPAEGPCLFEPT
ncbi:MAG: acetyl-CoA acetyltransferase [Acidimicrobiia bacterium]|nr:acetyl-CoA acetyltransferase [Acidimicrobiia bacterium]